MALSTLSDMLDKRETYDSLLTDIEVIIGKPLDSQLVQDIYMLHEQYDFEFDRIKEFFKYLRERGVFRTKYIIKVADTWQKDGIGCGEECKAKEQERLDNLPEGFLAVCGAFGMQPNVPTEYDREKYDRWEKEYKTDLLLMVEACKITLSKINAPSFAYADAIIKDWHDRGVHSMVELERYQAQVKAERGYAPNMVPQKKKNDFHNFNERDYDYNELMQIALGQNKD